VSRGVRRNALVKASERHAKERLYLSRVKGNLPPVRQDAYRQVFYSDPTSSKVGKTADKIDRIFGDTPELRQAILLSTIVTCLDRLLA
jgi:hypothetical protein